MFLKTDLKTTPYKLFRPEYINDYFYNLSVGSYKRCSVTYIWEQNKIVIRRLSNLHNWWI